MAGDRAGKSPRRVAVSDEAMALIEWAKMAATGNRTNTEALDWLLRDLCEYGSPVVGARARGLWPDAVETAEWKRKHDDD